METLVNPTLEFSRVCLKLGAIKHRMNAAQSQGCSGCTDEVLCPPDSSETFECGYSCLIRDASAVTVASRMCRDSGQRLLNKSAFSAASDMLTAVERHQSERCVPCCSRSEKVRHLRLRDPSLPPSLPQQAAGTLLRTFNVLLFPKTLLRRRIFPPGEPEPNASRRLSR